MQDEWERISEHVELDSTTLERLMEPVAPARRVRDFEILEGGLANTNVRVRMGSSAESFVLRLYTRDPSACRREASVLERVRSSLADPALCPVPETLHCDPEGILPGVPYAITTWMPGEPLQCILGALSGSEREELGWSAGRALASLNAIEFAACGSLDEDLNVSEIWGPPHELIPREIRQMLYAGRAGECLGEGTRERLWALVEHAAPCLEPLGSTNTLVHADFKPPNLLARRDSTGRWRLTAVLDWEFACAGHPLFDVGIMLRSFDLYEDPFSLGFVRGFRSLGGALPEDWRRLVRLVDVNALCQFLDRPGQRPRLHADVRRRIEQFIGDWPQLSADRGGKR